MYLIEIQATIKGYEIILNQITVEDNLFKVLFLNLLLNIRLHLSSIVFGVNNLAESGFACFHVLLLLMQRMSWLAHSKFDKYKHCVLKILNFLGYSTTPFKKKYNCFKISKYYVVIITVNICIIFQISFNNFQWFQLATVVRIVTSIRFFKPSTKFLEYS